MILGYKKLYIDDEKIPNTYVVMMALLLQNYKPPTAYDIPEVMNVSMIEGDKSRGVLSSKGTGEPAVHLGLTVALAIRHAIMAAKKDLGTGDDWINLGKRTKIPNPQQTFLTVTCNGNLFSRGSNDCRTNSKGHQGHC